MSGIIEEFLLEGKFKALHGDFQSGGILRELLVHGGAGVDGDHDGIFRHSN